MKQADLSATHFVGSRFTTFVLVVAGLFFLFPVGTVLWRGLAGDGFDAVIDLARSPAKLAPDER